jgi:hypothetical protein
MFNYDKMANVELIEKLPFGGADRWVLEEF